MDSVIVDSLQECEMLLDEDYNIFDCPKKTIPVSSKGLYYIVIDFFNKSKRIYHMVSFEQAEICSTCEFFQNCNSLIPLTWDHDLTDFVEY